MYFPFFIIYLLIGFGISGLVFLWALKNGQFSDQKRAAFLPLQHDLESPPITIRRIHRFEAIVLMALACLGLLISASVLVFSLLKAR
jgi:cbb3-type cytochrome oxidase maturation protein